MGVCVGGVLSLNTHTNYFSGVSTASVCLHGQRECKCTVCVCLRDEKMFVCVCSADLAA